jgi:hypothetical protein
MTREEFLGRAAVLFAIFLLYLACAFAGWEFGKWMQL